MKRFIVLLVALAVSVSCISGCSSSRSTNENWNPLNSGKDIKIAVLGSEKQFSQYQDLFNGMDMAIEELAASGIKISYEKKDDQGIYDIARNTASDVVNEDAYALAISVQPSDFLSSVAYVFNEGKKPLIIASQATSRTMSYGYSYVMDFTLSAMDQGFAAGKTAVENNVKWVVAAHSDSAFDKEYINGFQMAIKGAQTSIVDIREISNSFSDLEDLAHSIKSIRPDCFLIAHYSSEYLLSAIKYARETQGANLPIIINTPAFNSESIDQYKNLAGIAQYPVSESEARDSFVAQYKAKYGVDAPTSAAEGYDAIKFIYEKIQGTKTSLDFMNNVKSDEGYNGVAKLKFDMYGRILTDSAKAFYIDSNGNINLHTVYF